MGRRSKLSEAQWEAMFTRLMFERPAKLSREYGVSKSVISERFAKKVREVRAVARQMLESEDAFNQLTVSEQVYVVAHLRQQGYAVRLRVIWAPHG